LKNSILRTLLTIVGIVFHTGMLLFKNAISGGSNVDSLLLNYWKNIWEFVKVDYTDRPSGNANLFLKSFPQ
jgi:hypothetical protein